MNAFDFIKNSPVKGNIIVALLVFLLIWFVLPHLSIGGSHIFNSYGARFSMIGLFGFVWLLRWFINQLQMNGTQTWAVIKTQFQTLGQACRQFFHRTTNYSKNKLSQTKFRLQNSRKKRRLKKLPWYLVLGHSQSGKKTFIANSGLYFAKPEHFGHEAQYYIQQFPDFDWWFSEQAVLIDAMSYDHDSDISNWKKLLKLLKRERKRKPLNGIILTLSLPELLILSNQQRQEFIQDICKYIRDLHDQFKCQVPVYSIFSKCDQVEGFLEFFNDLSKEELSQVWGMTIPLNESSELVSVRKFFTTEYHALITQLRKRVLWALDTERNPRGRELIHAFPQQMQLFRKPIENFIVELFGATRYPNALQFRGVYFTSGTQVGEPHDFLFHAMSKKFQLVPPAVQRPQRESECYFLRRLFFEVILSEASFLGDSEKSKRMRLFFYHTSRVLLPAAVVLATTGMYSGYQYNLANIKQINQDLTEYQQEADHITDTSSSITTILPLLSPLQHAHDLYTSQSHWSMHLLYESGSIKNTINDARNRFLQNMYMPRVAALIENRLDNNIGDPDLLYATLKGYLAFDANSKTTQNAIKPPMEYMWKWHYLKQPQERSLLTQYLNLALQQPIAKLPVDRDLINRIRAKLEAIIPSRRAYGLLILRAGVIASPAIYLPSHVGGNFSKIFNASYEKAYVPGLYTKRGFNEIFLNQYGPISREVAEDNKDIGLSTDQDAPTDALQISKLLHIRYHHEYVQHWQKALDNIDVSPFNSLSDAIDKLNLLTGSQSPLPALLNIVYDNTSTVSQGKITVNSDFTALNAYSNETSKSFNWTQTVKLLTDIKTYLDKIEKSADPDLASFNAAKALMSGKPNPISTLSEQALNAPQPARRWLLSIANNAWQVLAMGAHRQINAAWQNQVLPEYNNYLKNRFPLQGNANSQVSIDAFNHFFAVSGTIQTYFNHYMRPFINTENKQWTLYQVDEHSLELPQSSVKLFEKAYLIQQHYFPEGGDHAKLSFSIKPHTLDSNASSINFSIGDREIHYSHGPQNNILLHWPMTASDEHASTVITNFDGQHYTLAANGPWSLFKLFNQGNFHATSTPGHYIFALDLGHYHASFLISGAGDIDIFKLNNLLGFNVPTKIAP